jgi:hypothetical protein
MAPVWLLAFSHLFARSLLLDGAKKWKNIGFALCGEKCEK